MKPRRYETCSVAHRILGRSGEQGDKLLLLRGVDRDARADLLAKDVDLQLQSVVRLVHVHDRSRRSRDESIGLEKVAARNLSNQSTYRFWVSRWAPHTNSAPERPLERYQ